MVSAPFPNRGFNLRENVWLIQQDVAGNRSQVGFEAWIDKTNNLDDTFSSGKANRQMTFNGTVVATTNENGFDFRQDNMSWKVLVGSAWVNHAADGSGPLAIILAADYDILGAVAVNANTTLPKIARASTATISGGSSFPAGSAVTINTNRADTGFTHKIEYNFGNQQGTISTNAGASVSWTPPLSLLTQIPTSTSGTGSIYVTTYQGSTQIGSRTTTGFTLTAPSSVVPTISPLTGTDTNPTVASVVGAYVQNLSRLKVGVSAAGAHGSTIVGTEVTVDGVKGSPSSSYALPTAGTRNISAKVTDSRGRTATRTGTVPVLAYTPPAVASVNVRRATSTGTVNSGESYLRIDLNATVKSLVNGSERNSMTIRIRTRPTNGAWTNRNTINGALTYNNNFIVSGGAVFPPTASFDVEVKVTDAVGQQWVRIITIATDKVLMDWVDTNVGIGKFWERGALDVGGHVYINGNLWFSGSMTSGSVPFARIPDAPIINGGTISGTALPSAFGVGVTFGQAGTGFPESIGTVMNVRHSAYRQFQHFYDRTTKGTMYTRTSNGDDAWQPWQRIATTGEGDTGWFSPGTGSGWGPYAGENVRYRVKSGICYLSGRTSGTTAAPTLLFTLPAGYRHDAPEPMIFATHSDNGSTIMSVASDGKVEILSRTGQSRSGVSLAGISFPIA